MQVSVRLFTNDLETSLKKAEGKAIDVYHPADSVLLNKQLSAYLQACLKIRINGKDMRPDFLGFEREGESSWLYLSIPACPKPTEVSVSTTILYNSFPQQAHIIQAEVAGTKKSVRLSFPESIATFDF